MMSMSDDDGSDNTAAAVNIHLMGTLTIHPFIYIHPFIVIGEP